MSYVGVGTIVILTQNTSDQAHEYEIEDVHEVGCARCIYKEKACCT